MSDNTVEMKTIPAAKLRRDHVFEMFGNLYQVDVTATIGGATQVQAHIIAQLGTPKAFDGEIILFLSPKTTVSIEA